MVLGLRVGVVWWVVGVLGLWGLVFGVGVFGVMGSRWSSVMFVA